jgi:uncharacterized protein (DUF302 family)
VSGILTVNGLISLPSVDGYGPTVERLERAFADRKIVPMLRWDHAAAAAGVGLELRPLLLVVFGDPKLGTALMQKAPTAGIDLPLKLLVWKDASEQVLVGYNDPAWLRARHGLMPVPGPSGGMALTLREIAAAAAGDVGA